MTGLDGATSSIEVADELDELLEQQRRLNTSCRECGGPVDFDPWSGTVWCSACQLEYLADPVGGSTWSAIDLNAAISGEGLPEAALLSRTDDVCLWYRGRVHWIQGESESLKSWLAQLGVAQVLLDGGSAIWIDFEDDELGVTARMRALGVSADVLRDWGRFRYVRPDEPLYRRDGTALPGAVGLSHLMARSWDVVVIDGVTEAMTIEGMSYTDNADIATWMRRLPKPIADRTGAAVACIDHLPKSADNHGRFAIGGQHKMAGADGAVYKVTSTRRLSRALADPVTGVSKITVEKDRPGWVRARADDGLVGELEVTAYPDNGVSARIVPPDQARTTPPWALCQRVLEYLTIYAGASKTSIEENVTGKVPTIREALRYLVAQGWVTVEQVGQTHRHHITDEGRAVLNEDRDDA